MELKFKYDKVLKKVERRPFSDKVTALCKKKKAYQQNKNIKKGPVKELLVILVMSNE